MLKIIYTSRVRSPMGSDEVSALADAASANNQKIGVTGLLLASPFGFLQYLEGPTQPLIRLMDKISRYPRHYDVVILEREKISTRLFPNWSMNSIAVNVKEITHNHGVNAGSQKQALNTLSSVAMRWVETDPRNVDLQILIREIAASYGASNQQLI